MTKTVNSVSVTYVTDAGHGWLVLARDEARQIMGDAFFRITPFSYQHQGQVMLEEDSDAALFVQCCKQKNVKIGVREIDHGDSSVIRTLASFSPDEAVFTAEDLTVSDEPEAPAEVEPEAPAEVEPEPPQAPVAQGFETWPRPALGQGDFCLPAQLLWAMAQVASSDPSNSPLDHIEVHPHGNLIQIAASDGYILLVARVPAINNIFAATAVSIPATAVVKCPAKAERVQWNGTLMTHTARVGSVLQGQLPTFGMKDHPDYVRLVPSQFTNAPNAPIAFSPELMGVLLKVAGKLQAPHVRLQSNAPTAAMALEFEAVLPCYKDPVTLKALIMPVQVRS